MILWRLWKQKSPQEEIGILCFLVFSLFNRESFCLCVCCMCMRVFSHPQYTPFVHSWCSGRFLQCYLWRLRFFLPSNSVTGRANEPDQDWECIILVTLGERHGQMAHIPVTSHLSLRPILLPLLPHCPAEDSPCCLCMGSIHSHFPFLLPNICDAGPHEAPV